MRGTAVQTALALMPLLAGLSACSGNEFCSERREALLRTDGGSSPCLLSSDCPRPANAQVCLDDNPNPPMQECVRCEQPPGADGGTVSVCVRVIPELCR